MKGSSKEEPFLFQIYRISIKINLNMNIGITVGLQEENESLWINGIKLNVLNLVETLSRIGEHNVYILDTSKKVSDLTKVSWNTEEYPIFKYAEKIESTDLLILLGTSFSSEQTSKCKKAFPKIKIIKYHCGNNYVIDMERTLFHNGGTAHEAAWTSGHDETWLIPQQEYHNRDYYQTIGRLPENKVKVVPFVWSPKFIKEEAIKYKKLANKDVYYLPGKNPKDMNISSMEPNMNTVKYVMPLIMMTEQLYRRKGKDAFNEFWIGSGKRLLKSKYFLDCVGNLDLTSSGKLKLCSRYPTHVFLAEKTDVMVSHQMDNPLNYAYLDVMYFGYPLVHNAHMIKDAGYYYSGFKTTAASKLLEDVMNHHDELAEDYNKKNTKVLFRYMTVNPDVIDTYRKLIDNVFEPGKHKMSNEYNWETNLYK